MSEPIDELVTYADHTQGCMVGAGNHACTCGYDDAHAKMWAAWEALKAENARLAAALLAVRAAEVNGPSLVRDIDWALNHGQNLSSVLRQRVDAYINATACLCHGRFPCPGASDTNALSPTEGAGDALSAAPSDSPADELATIDRLREDLKYAKREAAGLRKQLAAISDALTESASAALPEGKL